MPRTTIDELIDKWTDALDTFKAESDWEGVNLTTEILEDLQELR